MTRKTQLNQGRKFAQVRSGAKGVFFSDGYSGASVDEIARAARVSKATLYSYFPEKRMMYHEVVTHAMAQMSERCPISIPGDMPAGKGLPLMAQQIAGWLISPTAIQMHRASIAEAIRFPDLSRRYHQTLNTLLRDAVRDHLKRWVAAGQLRIDDIHLAAEQLVRLSGALIHDHALLADGTNPGEDVVHQIGDSAARLFLAAYGADGQKPVSLAAAS